LPNCAVLFLLFAAGIIVKLNRTGTILLYLPRDSLSNQALLFFLFVVLCHRNHCQIVPYGTVAFFFIHCRISCQILPYISALYLPRKSLSNRTALFSLFFALGMIVKSCCTFLLYICHRNHCQWIGIINVLSLYNTFAEIWWLCSCFRKTWQLVWGAARRWEGC
jgi:hypothetical protein